MPPKSDGKRTRILEAAEALFRRGLERDVTIEDVARKARVSKGTVYTYFPDKEELFFQAEVYRMRMVVAMLEEEIPPNLSFIPRIREVINRLHHFFQDRIPVLSPRNWLHLPPDLEDKGRRDKMRAARAILLDYLASVFDQGVREGVLRTGLETRRAARHLVVLMKARHLEQLVEPDSAMSLEDSLSLFLFGVAQCAGNWDASEMDELLEGKEKAC